MSDDLSDRSRLDGAAGVHRQDEASDDAGGLAAGQRRSQLESVARQWISLWCAPVDWGLFDRLHADDFVDCSAAGRDPTKEAFADALADFVAAFPDLRTQVDDLVIDEYADRVAVRWSSTGTNRTPFLGIGPTERQVIITGIEIIQVSQGRIARRWGEWDISRHVDEIR